MRRKPWLATGCCAVQPWLCGGCCAVIRWHAAGLTRCRKTSRDSPLTEYKNPQNDPGSQQRMLLLLVFFFIAIIALPYFMPKPQPPAQQQKPSEQTSQTSSGQIQPLPTHGAPAAAIPGQKATPAQTV